MHFYSSKAHPEKLNTQKIIYLPELYFINNRFIVLVMLCLTLGINSVGQIPGGVTNSSLKLWFKSNQGVSSTSGNVSQWNDVSAQGNVITQPSKIANTHVMLRTSGANYNPTILFAGTRLEQLKGSANNLGGIPTLFTVSRSTNTAVFNPIFSNMEINPAVPDPNTAKEVGPGLFIYFDRYVIDANSAWLPSSADAPAVNNQLDIMTSIYGSSTSTANSELYQNGVLADLHTGPTTVVTPGKKVIEIGGRSGDDADYPGRIFKGDIAEIIYFTDRLNSSDCQKVESYLAIKYGITLFKNYLSSNSTLVYDVSSYSKRIIGIGRDDASGLLQKQSKGENYTSILEIGLSAIATDNGANMSTFGTDRSFIIAGDDDQNPTGTTSGVPPGIESWLIRKWKSTCTGASASNIVFQMPSSVLNTLPGTGEISILFSNDNTFTTGLSSHKMNLSANSYTAVIPQITTGIKYFTFVRCLKPFAGNDISLCNVTSSYDFTDAASFQNWLLVSNPPGVSPLINGANGIVTGLSQSGVYSFALMNATCQCYDTVILNKGTAPLISGVSSNNPVCEGGSLNLFANSSSNNYNWTGPAGFNSAIANPVILSASQTNAGSYTFTSSNFDCLSSQTIDITVNIKPKGGVSPDTILCTTSPIQLAASGGSSYAWSPVTGLSNPTISNPVATPVSTTTYTIQVINSAGCRDTVNTTILIDQALCDGIIHFPSAFTPNNDGLNDQFRATSGYAIIVEFELKIFNRWGQLVFYTKDPGIGWDGKFKSALQDSNIFAWYSTYTLRNGKSYFRKGTFLLIR